MVVHAHPILYMFMFLKISIRKSLRKKKGKSVTFSLKVPPGLVPCDLELPSLLPKGRLQGCSVPPPSELGTKTAAERDMGLPRKASGSTANHVYYMQFICQRLCS